jgi:hypothetical protein
MIKHIVMWNVKGDSPEDRTTSIERIRLAFEGLIGRIPGLVHLEIGVDVSRVDYACDVVLYSEFETRDLLRAYGEHPEHLRIKRDLGDLRIARHQVDYQVASSNLQSKR